MPVYRVQMWQWIPGRPVSSGRNAAGPRLRSSVLLDLANNVIGGPRFEGAPPKETMANVTALCEERLKDHAREEVLIRAKFEERIAVLRAQLSALEKARDAELEVLDSVGAREFAEISLRLLSVVREIRENGRWVVNGDATVKKWKTAAAEAEDSMRPVVDEVRAGLEGLVIVPDAVFQARGRGAAQGYKAHESELTDFYDAEVRLPGEDWADASHCLLADTLEPFEDPFEDAVNDFFDIGDQKIDDYDMKECLVSGTSCVKSDLLMSGRLGV